MKGFYCFKVNADHPPSSRKGYEHWHPTAISVQFSHSILSDSFNPMDCSLPGFPVHHQFPELTQTHVHRIGNAIQPSHSLLFPSPPTFDLSQHQGLFKCVNSSHQVANILEFQLQHQSFQWIFRIDGLITLQSKGISRVFSNTTVQKHHFLGTQPSLSSNCPIYT